MESNHAEDKMEEEASKISSLKSEIQSAEDSETHLLNAHSKSTGSARPNKPGVNSLVRDFSNYEDPHDPIFFTGKRRESYKYRWLFVISYLSMSMTCAAYWRFPSVFLNLMGDSNGLTYNNEYSIWNFLTPWAIALVCIGWPVLITESATADLARGGAMQVFGSVGKRFRCAGMNFLVALTIATFVPHIMGDAFSYLVHSFDSDYAGVLYDDSVEGPWTCTGFETSSVDFPWLPLDSADMRMLTVKNDTAPISLRGGQLFEFTDEDSLLDYDKKTQPPWMTMTYCSELLHCAGAAAYKMDQDKESYDNRLLSTKYAAPFANFGWPFVWEKTVGICVVWLLACIFCLLSHKYMQWVRPIILLYGLAMFICAVIFGGIGAESSISELRGYNDLDPRKVSSRVDTVNDVFRSGSTLKTALTNPGTWAFAISQSLYGLSLCQGVIAEFSYNAGRFTENLVVDNSWYMFFSTAFNIGWGFVVLCGAIIGIKYIDPNKPPCTDVSGQNMPSIGSSLVAQMVNGYPGHEIFVGLAATFTIYTSPGPLSFCLYLSFLLLGANELSGVLLSLVTGFAGNATNSNTARRAAFTVGFTFLCFAMNVILFWSIGLSFTMGFCHYAIDILLPLMTYIDMTAIGWFINWKWYRYRMGSGAAWTQFVLYTLGIWTAGIGTGILWNKRDNSWESYICMVIGVGLMFLSIVIPPFFAKSTDPDNTKQSLWFRFKFMFWGKAETLRDQINVTCCHTTKFWRLTPLWTLLVRYIVPFGCVFACCIPLCTIAGTTNFSVYFPFLINYDIAGILQQDIRAAVAPWYVLTFSALLPILVVVLLVFYIVLPNLLASCGCTPKDAMEFYFLPVDAETTYANLPDTQLPRDPSDTTK